jgi:hypothetical protein
MNVVKRPERAKQKRVRAMFVLPFQGVKTLATKTQGVALGWYVIAFQAKEIFEH